MYKNYLMGNIKILTPDIPSFAFVREGVEYYLNKLKKFVKIEVILPKSRIKAKDAKQRLMLEERVFRKYLDSKGYLIVLDEKGKLFDTLSFTRHLEKLLFSFPSLIFLIGGPEGVSENIKKEAKELLSLSPLTFNHEIAILVLLEVLYRSFTILRGVPYHRG